MMRTTFALVICSALLAGCGSDTTVASQERGTTMPKSIGKLVFDKWCAACHAPGTRQPGTASLAVKYGKEMPAALEERKDLTPELIAIFVRQGVSIMPPFRKTEITDADLKALGAYLSHQPEPAAPTK